MQTSLRFALTFCLGSMLNVTQALALEIEKDDRPHPSTQNADAMDPVIEALLAGGGSYTQITDPLSQENLADFITELDKSNPATRTFINLPLNLMVYGLAKANDNRNEPDYIYTADESVTIKVTVDSKNNFMPKLTINEEEITQTNIEPSLYEVILPVNRGQSYHIRLNEAATDKGLYSIHLSEQ